MLYSRGERSRWLSRLSIRLSYDPFDNCTQTGYCRPPPFPACVLDYFKAISNTSEEFQAAEMLALMRHDDFFPLVDAQDLDGEDTLMEAG